MEVSKVNVCCFLDQELSDLLEVEVNDLVKYNIVSFLYNNPDTVGDAQFYAKALGFHSPDRTQSALDELVDCKILKRGGPGSSRSAVYSLSDDEVTRRRLMKLWAVVPGSPEHAEILRQLASRSVDHVKPRGRNKDHPTPPLRRGRGGPA
ncbi:MAG: hypothetical protein M1136_03140 [Chloroflexi bacterium]|nr:hypothetical protein [Chloroflexota bacterium]